MFYMQECRDIIVSLNTEILEKPWKSIKVITLFHSWPFTLLLTCTRRGCSQRDLYKGTSQI